MEKLYSKKTEWKSWRRDELMEFTFVTVNEQTINLAVS